MIRRPAELVDNEPRATQNLTPQTNDFAIKCDSDVRRPILMRVIFLSHGLAPLSRAAFAGHRFGVGCSRLLLHLSRCTLGTFASEAAGKLASITRVDLRVVLSPRN